MKKPKEMNEERLAELKSMNLARATPKNCGMKPRLKRVTKEVERACEEYLRPFLPPSFKCINCGAEQCGFFGYFRWSNQHGEGGCSRCGYPARAYHKIKVAGRDDAEINFIGVLQYHPSQLDFKREEQKR